MYVVLCRAFILYVVLRLCAGQRVTTHQYFATQQDSNPRVHICTSVRHVRRLDILSRLFGKSNKVAGRSAFVNEWRKFALAKKKQHNVKSTLSFCSCPRLYKRLTNREDTQRSNEWERLMMGFRSRKNAFYNAASRSRCHSTGDAA